MNFLLKILLILVLFTAKGYGNINNDRNTNTYETNSMELFLKENEQNKDYLKNLRQANDYLDKFEYEKSIKYSQIALKLMPNDYLARALICLDYYEISEGLNINNEVEKKIKFEFYDLMEKTADEGIKFAPNQGECYFLRGLAKARRVTAKGVLASLFAANSIEQDWLKAVELKEHSKNSPSEYLMAYTYLSLGIYYRLCPSFFLIKLIFGISGDLNKSVYYCRKAYELAPNRIEMVKELGVSLISRGLDRNDQKDINKGKEYLTMVDEIPIIMKTDYLDKIQCKKLLNNIKLCPGYSRDQEQDISEETFKKLQQKTKTNK